MKLRTGQCLTVMGLLGLVTIPLTALGQAPLGPTVIGKIVWAEHDLTRGQVRVYGDKGLTKLVDQFGTGGAGGTFVLLVPPGDYYLMAVVDENGNEKMDEGDGLGFFGVTKFGAEGQEPKVLQVAKDAVVGDVRIPITAVIGGDGRPEPVEASPPVETPPTGIPASVGGTLTNVEQLEVPAFLMVLAAEAHRPVATVRATTDKPDFHFSVSAGDYHLIAVADVSGDRRLGARDRVGAYGVADWSEPPTELPPLTLAAGDEIGGIQVAMTAHLGEDGVVRSLAGPGSFQLDAGTLPAIISGVVIYPGAGLKPAQVRLSADPGMSQPIASIECEPGPGTFVTHVNPGTYYLTAVVDENNDGRFGPGDGVGFYGIDDLASANAPPPLTVENGSLVADLSIRIAARVTDDLKLAPIPPGEEKAPRETEN